MTERQFAIETVRILQRAGFRALWAGGCVRDELLGLAPNDYDVATDARPEQVQQLFRRCVAIGAAFGVIEVVGPRQREGGHLTVEVATFRSDGAYTDGRRPDTVIFSSPEEDAQRRDFTINGMFFDPVTEELFDFVGGRRDLADGVLRAIGNPGERFAEDKLRVLRAVRMAARFALRLEPDTAGAIRLFAPQLHVVSAERIAEELRKLLIHPTRSVGVRLLRDLGLAGMIFPEIEPFEGPDFTTVISGLEGADVSFPLGLAGMMGTMPLKNLTVIADRLRLSSHDKQRLLWMVDHSHSLINAQALPPSRLYPILSHPGAAELIALHRAIARSSKQPDDHIRFCEQILAQTPPEVLDPASLVSGDDLKAVGLKPGPAFKRLLETVRNHQLDGIVRTKEEGLILVEQLLAAERPPSP